MKDMKNKVGEIVKVKIESIESYGLRVIDSAGNKGLVKLPEISWDVYGLQNRMSEEFDVGSEIDAKILCASPGIFYASLKQVKPELDPWVVPVEVNENYTCVILQVTEYGYLVKLPNSVVAVLHSDDSCRDYSPGETLDVSIKDVDVSRERVRVCCGRF